MFYRIARRVESPNMTVEGLGLIEYEPCPSLREELLNEASKWALAVTTVENNRHLCYNHLTDCGWTSEQAIRDVVTVDGEFCGALLYLEDEYEFGSGLKKTGHYAVLTADGRAFGRPEAELIYSASAYGRSRTDEYTLVRKKGERVLLVTAFEPFGEDSLNPTELILRRLPNSVGNVRIEKLLLPVEFEAAPKKLTEEYERLSPAAVLMLGQAGGRACVTPERRAVNRADARIPDNAGFKPEGLRLEEDGEEELYSTLDPELIRNAIMRAGLPAAVSESAGTFVCNALLYRMLRRGIYRTPACFVHVPFIREQTEGLPERATAPYMELEDELKAARAAIEAVAEMIK